MTGESVDSPIPAIGTTPARRFGVADGMILVAGLGLALASGLKLMVALGEQIYYMCEVIAAYDTPFYARRPAFWWGTVAIYWSSVLFYGLRVLEIILLAMTPAFLLVRLRRPRAPIPAVFRQPGTVAALAMVFGEFWVTGWLHRLFFGRLRDPTVTAVAVGATVAVAWAALALSGKWKSELSWVDRMGRLLGAAAVAVGALSFALHGI